jgi:hypothetical protein
MSSAIADLLTRFHLLPVASLHAAVSLILETFPLRNGLSSRFHSADATLKSAQRNLSFALYLADADPIAAEKNACREAIADQLHSARMHLRHGVSKAEEIAREAAAVATRPQLLRYTGKTSYEPQPTVAAPQARPRQQRPAATPAVPMDPAVQRLWNLLSAEKDKDKERYHGQCLICAYLKKPKKQAGDYHGFRNCPFRQEALAKSEALEALTKLRKDEK